MENLIKEDELPKDRIHFNDEVYQYEEYENGSKRIFKERNKNGFKINIVVSGDQKELERGIRAVKDFYINTF